MELKSKISGENCKPAHFLTEFIMIRAAARKRVTLPHKFWQLDSFKKDYKTEIVFANRLLKMFNIEDIIHVLSLKENNWISTLKFKSLMVKISDYIDTKPKVSETKIKVDDTNIVSVPSVKKQKNIRELL